MATFRLATSRSRRNPVRSQQWNAVIRSGDDFKVAVTVYADDSGTLADVTQSRSLLALVPDQHWRGGFRSDYGWGWFTYACQPTQQVAGYAPGPPGRLNFVIPSAATAAMTDRYRFVLQVDLFDGEFTQIDGVLAVRAGVGGLVHQYPNYFQLDVSPLPAQFAPLPLNAARQPVDADGFLLCPDAPQSAPIQISPSSSGVLGLGVLGSMVLGSSGQVSLGGGV